MQENKQLSFDDNLKKQMLEKNRIIVRIWTSKINQVKPGKSVGHISIENPAENIYWSLWPKQKTSNDPSSLSAKEEEGLGVITPISTEEIQDLTYQRDRDEFEGRDPELVFCFYTLDIVGIKDKFEELCQSNIKWNFVGRLFFLNAGSCASSAWELLEGGNIHNLVSSLTLSSVASTNASRGSYLSGFWSLTGTRQQSAGNPQLAQEASTRSAHASLYATEMAVSPLVKSPDYIGEILKKAKSKELETNRLTQHISFPGEEAVSFQQPTQSSSWSWCPIL